MLPWVHKRHVHTAVHCREKFSLREISNYKCLLNVWLRCFFGDLKFNGFKSKHVQIVVSLATKQNLLSIKVNPKLCGRDQRGKRGVQTFEFIITRQTEISSKMLSQEEHDYSQSEDHEDYTTSVFSRPNPFPSWKNKKFSHLPWGRISQRRTNSEAPTNFQICVRVYTHYPYFARVCVTFSNLQCRQGCGLFGLMAEKPIFTVFSKSHLNVSPLSEKVIRTVHYHKIKGERFRVISLYGITKYASFTGKQGMCLKL